MDTPTRTLVQSSQVVLPGANGRLEIRPACVEVWGTQITALHDHGTQSEGPLPVEDLGDLLVTPAFVDSHTHLAMAAMRGIGVDAAADGNLVEDLFFGLESRLTPEDVRAFTRVGAYEALLHGTALVWDHYYYGESVAAGLLDAGLAGVVAPTLQDVSGPGAGSWEETLEATVRIAGDSSLADRGIFAALGPHAPDTVSPQLVRRIADLAESQDLPAHVHVAQSVDEVRLIKERYATTPTGHIREIIDAAPTSLLVHGVWCTDVEVAALQGTRAQMVLCPGSALIFAWPARVDRWRDADLKWSIGTDCPVCNDGINVQRDLRMAAAIPAMGLGWSSDHEAFMASGELAAAEAGWGEREAVRGQWMDLREPSSLLAHVWDTPGAAHPAFRVGTLEAGALANLVAWDTSHPSFWPARDVLGTLVRGDVSPAIHNVMVAGRWRGAHGDYARGLVAAPEWHEAREEADERLRALRARAS